MKGFLFVLLVSLGVSAWFMRPEPASLLFAGAALTGIGMLARRRRPTQKNGT
jgi:hypothetical protein